MSETILSEGKTNALKETGKWARIFAAISIASMVVSLIQVLATSGGNATLLITSLFITLLGSSISIALVVFLIYFNKHATQGLNAGDNQALERGLNNFKWYFALNGILLIIALGLFLLAMLGALIFGAIAA